MTFGPSSPGGSLICSKSGQVGRLGTADLGLLPPTCPPGQPGAAPWCWRRSGERCLCGGACGTR